MNSAPHLLTEDRADFERILDETLRHARDRPDLADVGQRLNAEQLRTMALNATALITAAAAAEYEHYVKVREHFRTPTAPAPGDSVLAPAVVGATEGATETGAGLAAVVTVLVPVLAGAAAVVFLLVGYILRLLSPVPAFSDTLLSVGWFFGAVAALGLLVAAAGLLITALRNSSTQFAVDEPDGAWPDEVSQAREEWRDALLERGIVPFLRAAPAPAARPAPKPHPVNHLPKMGYSRPDFSSPDDGATAGRRPKFSSPDFSSPDYGPPEHQPD